MGPGRDVVGRAWRAVEDGVELSLRLRYHFGLCRRLGAFVQLGLRGQWVWDGPQRRERVFHLGPSGQGSFYEGVMR